VLKPTGSYLSFNVTPRAHTTPWMDGWVDGISKALGISAWSALDHFDFKATEGAPEGANDIGFTSFMATKGEGMDAGALLAAQEAQQSSQNSAPTPANDLD
jgi:hypothetical protein